MFSWYANVQRDLKYYFKALDREPAVREKRATKYCYRPIVFLRPSFRDLVCEWFQ